MNIKSNGSGRVCGPRSVFHAAPRKNDRVAVFRTRHLDPAPRALAPLLPLALACALPAPADEARVGTGRWSLPSGVRSFFERAHPEAQIQTAGVFDDNIYIRHDHPVSDFIWATTPRVGLGVGDLRKKQQNYLSVSYAPSFLVFFDNPKNNAVDHEAQLGVQYRTGNWKLNLDQNFETFSGSETDVGNRVNRTTYRTAAGAEYAFSGKTLLSAHVDAAVNDYERLIDFNDVSGGLAADYLVTPKIKLGLGVTLGAVEVPQGIDQNYEQLRARAAYLWSDKLDVQLSAGGEYRQFNSDADDRLNPVFSLDVNYFPEADTKIVLQSYRREQTSAVIANYNFSATGVRLSASRLFWVKYVASIALGYENAEYYNVDSAGAIDRQDDYFIARAGFDCRLTDHLTAGLFYQFREDISSTRQFSFDNNQAGAGVTYKF